MKKIVHNSMLGAGTGVGINRSLHHLANEYVHVRPDSVHYSAKYVHVHSQSTTRTMCLFMHRDNW